MGNEGSNHQQLDSHLARASRQLNKYTTTTTTNNNKFLAADLRACHATQSRTRKCWCAETTEPDTQTRGAKTR